MPTPLTYARAACDTMMRRYDAADLPPKGHFHYHQGVFLSGLCQIAALCGDTRYWDYAAAWMRSVFTPEGKIRQYNHAVLDDIQPGVVLFDLLDHDPAGGDFYRAALASVAAQLPDIPRCRCGGFYHNVAATGQMWLDGLYMLCPFMTRYANLTHDPALLQTAVEEILCMRRNTRDAATGLWYHAWDETRQAPWADPETGLSPEFWGRSMGWVPVAVLDVLDQLPADHPQRPALSALVADLLAALARYQGVDGRWYQVVNKPGAPGNWQENSCTCLFGAAMARAARAGLVPPDYADKARRAFAGVAASLTWQGEDLLIGGVCVGTGVGDYDFYCARPTSTNDLHGVGAFLLLCAALARP